MLCSEQKNLASPQGSLGALLVAPTVKNLPVMQETWVQSLGREDPLEKRMATHSSILAWRILWTEEPGGLLVCPQGHKESDTTEQLTYAHNLLKQQNGLVHSKQK